MEIKRIGFWAENSWSSRSIEKDILEESKRIIPKDQILDYLKIGIPILFQRTMSHSKVTGEVFGPVTAYTDGTWAWTNILIHYYAAGWIDIPDEFKNHIKQVNPLFLKLGLMSKEKKKEIANMIKNTEYEIITLRKD